MNQKSKSYLERLKTQYSKYGDNDSLLALAEVEQADERARGLRIYREQERTQELIRAALQRYKNSLEKISHPDSQKMTNEERAYCFATMDWAKFTLDIIGESPEQAEKMVDTMVENYARKSGFIEDL